MKSTVATALSLVAVLAAGALAAAANFRVLAGPDDAAGASTIGAAAPNAAEAAAEPESAGDEGPQTFTIGPAGSLTLDATGGLHLVRIEPSFGWRAEHRPAPAGTVIVAFHPSTGPAIVVTAERGGGGIHVVAHEETTTSARPAADDELDADDD